MDNHWHLTYQPPTSSCPRGLWMTPKKKWKSSHAENRSYQLTHAGRPANQGQIGQHSYFLHGRIFIFCFFWTLGHQYCNSEWFFALVTAFYLNFFWRVARKEGTNVWVSFIDRSLLESEISLNKWGMTEIYSASNGMFGIDIGIMWVVQLHSISVNSAIVRDFNWRVQDLATSRKNQTKK